jgi:hypothetical protein
MTTIITGDSRRVPAYPYPTARPAHPRVQRAMA